MTAQTIDGEVRATIARLNVPQARIAEALGLTRSQFSRRVNGRVEFTATEIGKLAEFLEVSPGIFFPEVAA